MRTDNKWVFGSCIAALGVLFSLPCFLFIAGCSGGGGVSEEPFNESLLGGDTTVIDATSQAFRFPAPNLSDMGLQKHMEGDNTFETVFIARSGSIRSGLGPIYGNDSCARCHINNGRGEPDEKLTSLVFRISIPGQSEIGGPNPVPGFGIQLQDKAILGTSEEASVLIEYEEIEGQYADGTNYTLRKPTYTVTSSYILFPDDSLLSPRIASFVFGIGLLEAIPEETILSLADPDDTNVDGISGRPNLVWSFENQEIALGRIGWKAGVPSAFEQAARAFNEDMGVTNPLLSHESSFGQTQFNGLDDDPELNFETLDTVVFYVQTLAVPARRNVDDPQVKRGQELFSETKCSSCHIPVLETGRHPTRNEPVLSNQVILPYTDLLLHDMGEGLADG
ncbi:MAG: thiol oxidoreductase, partial [Candidatus Dadabacteria bacterium]|nr:thiol oxidoreductase [Candidatus Dadabacteria bacterium]